MTKKCKGTRAEHQRYEDRLGTNRTVVPVIVLILQVFILGRIL